MVKVKGENATPIVEAFSDIYSNALTSTGVGAFQLSAERVTVWQVLVQNHPDNAQNIRIGNQNRQDVVLRPAENITLPIDSLTKIYVYCPGANYVVPWIAVG